MRGLLGMLNQHDRGRSDSLRYSDAIEGTELPEESIQFLGHVCGCRIGDSKPGTGGSQCSAGMADSAESNRRAFRPKPDDIHNYLANKQDGPACHYGRLGAMSTETLRSGRSLMLCTSPS